MWSSAKGCQSFVFSNITNVLLHFRNIVLTDPCAYEEEICGGLGANLIVCSNNGVLCGTHKYGGSSLTENCQEAALKIGKHRSKLIEDVINKCVKEDVIILDK